MGKTLYFITLFRTKDKIHTVLFQSHLLRFYTWKQNSSSKSNQSCWQYPVDRLTQSYIPCLGQGGQKAYHNQPHIPVLPYKGVGLGEG